MFRKTQRFFLASLFVLFTIMVSACGAGLVSEPTNLPDDTVSATAEPPSNDNGTDGEKADQPFAPQKVTRIWTGGKCR